MSPISFKALIESPYRFFSIATRAISCNWLATSAAIKLECAETASLSADTLRATSGSVSKRDASTAIVCGAASVTRHHGLSSDRVCVQLPEP